MEKDERMGLIRAGAGVMTLALFALVLWLLTENIGQGAARGWAIVATLLLLVGIPVAAFVGHRIGLTESKAHVEGIKTGVTQVGTAAGQALTAGAQAMDFRLHGLQRTREIVKEQPAQVPNIVLLPPQPQGGMRYLDGGNDE